MQIFVKTLSYGKTLTLETEETDSIESIKCQIADEEGIPPYKINLACMQGGILKDGHTLQDHHIGSECMVYMVAPFRGVQVHMATRYECDDGFTVQGVDGDFGIGRFEYSGRKYNNHRNLGEENWTAVGGIPGVVRGGMGYNEGVINLGTLETAFLEYIDTNNAHLQSTNSMHMRLDGPLHRDISRSLREQVFPSLVEHFPVLSEDCEVHLFLHYETGGDGAQAVNDGGDRFHNDLYEATIDINLTATATSHTFTGGGFDIEGGGFLPHLEASGMCYAWAQGFRPRAHCIDSGHRVSLVCMMGKPGERLLRKSLQLSKLNMQNVRIRHTILGTEPFCIEGNLEDRTLELPVYPDGDVYDTVQCSVCAGDGDAVVTSVTFGGNELERGCTFEQYGIIDGARIGVQVMQLKAISDIPSLVGRSMAELESAVAAAEAEHAKLKQQNQATFSLRLQADLEKVADQFK